MELHKTITPIKKTRQKKKTPPQVALHILEILYGLTVTFLDFGGGVACLELYWLSCQ